MLANNGHGADLAMPPSGGIGRILPANCLAVACPSAGEFPIALDFTTAVAAGGKVRVTLAKGERMPDGWMIDHKGYPTNDPRVYMTEPKGALLPFGGPVAHKGYGLAFVIDILSGALSPAGCSRENSEVKPATRFLCRQLTSKRFSRLRISRSEVKRFVDYVKSAEPAPGSDEVLVPGERSWRTRKERSQSGIPVPDATWAQVVETGRKVGLEL